MFVGKDIAAPRRNLPVCLFGIIFGEYSPIHGWVLARCYHKRFWGLWHSGGRAPSFAFLFPCLGRNRTIVVYLSTHKSFVTIFHEGLGKTFGIGKNRGRARPGNQTVNPRGSGALSKENTCSGGIAKRCLAMCVGKQGAHSGKTVDLWGLYLRVPMQASNPVILIINCNE